MDAEVAEDGLGRRASGFVLAPLVFATLWLAPLEVSVPAHRLAAILGAVVVLWITESIPMAMTAFLGVAAAVAFGVAPAAKAFAPFADPLIFLFIGTFMLARAIAVHRLDRRFAFAVLALPGVGARPARVLAALALVGCAISMWISNTATVAMVLPIALSLLAVLEGDEGRQPAFARALVLSVSFAASVGGLGTPVGTAPNLIGIGFIRRELGGDVPFFTWMSLGMPVSLALLGVAVANLGSSVRAAPSAEMAERIAAEHRALGPWTRGQVNACTAFLATVAMWVVPGMLTLVLGPDHPLCRTLRDVLPESVAAILGASLLFVLPTDLRNLEFTLPWDEAVQIDWWIVFLYGGGIALGTLAFDTGLAEALGRGLTGYLGIASPFGLLALSTALATVLSETTSNTASANMVVPVVIAFARSAGIDPLLPAVGATMGASLGFMLPVSTPCNAIVYGTGRIPLPFMMRQGIVLDVVGVVVIVAFLATFGPLVLEPR